jgi:hypothetical protein
MQKTGVRGRRRKSGRAGRESARKAQRSAPVGAELVPVFRNLLELGPRYMMVRARRQPEAGSARGRPFPEHGAAPASSRVHLERAATSAETIHLGVVAQLRAERRRSPEEQALDLLARGAVLTRAKLRDCVSVQNERLGVVLEPLERAGPAPSYARRLAASRRTLSQAEGDSCSKAIGRRQPRRRVVMSDLSAQRFCSRRRHRSPIAPRWCPPDVRWSSSPP